MADNHIFPFLWMRGEPEEVVRTEMAKIAACGIRAVCVEARPHDDFCGPGWWRDMDIVLDEAKKREMQVWILDDKHFPTGYANGLIEKEHPERKKLYIACTVADVFGSPRPLTLNVARMLKPTIGFWQIDDPVDWAERANNRLVAVLAARFGEGERFYEDTVDLTGGYDGTNVTFTLPEGQWRVHVIYQTRTDGGDDTYINMADKTSAHTQIEGVYEAHWARYGAEFGKTIAGFFSDEPQFGNIFDQRFDAKLGLPDMPLPWSDELAAMLKDRWGADFARRLPFLFAESAEMEGCPQARYDYMDCLTRLYEENFSRPIGKWCEDHGVEYIGHVVEDNGVHSRLGLGAGHRFRAMAGQHMAGIDAIGGQIVYGAPSQTHKVMLAEDGEFFHYALGKLGASGGHLDPKKRGRTMCELFGAYGWSFGVRDMRYLLDHLLCRGVNYLVPHAFSMAEYPDHDCPPHFYARGRNPEFPWFADLMKYADRMCRLLSGGVHRASVAVLYDGEADWAGDHMPMQKVCRTLLQNQIEFDIVCLDMLENLPDYNGGVEGDQLTVNGVAFRALLLPQADYIPEKLARWIEAHPDFPVWTVGGPPRAVLGEGAVPAVPDVPLDGLAAALRGRGFCPISLDRPYPDLTVYHYEKNGQIFLLQNESAQETFAGTVRLPASGPLAVYDADSDVYLSLDSAGGQVELELAPGQSAVILEGRFPCAGVYQTRSARLAGCPDVLDLSTDWDVALIKAGEDVPAKVLHMDALRPVSDLAPVFSGVMRYERTFALDAVPACAYLTAAEVYEVLRVWVNGELAGTVLRPPYELEVSRYLRAGENRVVLEAANTPARDQLNYPMPPFDFSHEPMEPSGLCGQIRLLRSAKLV